MTSPPPGEVKDDSSTSQHKKETSRRLASEVVRVNIKAARSFGVLILFDCECN